MYSRCETFSVNKHSPRTSWTRASFEWKMRFHIARFCERRSEFFLKNLLESALRILTTVRKSMGRVKPIKRKRKRLQSNRPGSTRFFSVSVTAAVAPRASVWPVARASRFLFLYIYFFFLTVLELAGKNKERNRIPGETETQGRSG